MLRKRRKRNEFNEDGVVSKFSIEERISKLESYMEMEDRVTCSTVLIKLAELERLFADFMQKSSLNCEKRPKYCSECGNKNE